jgi:hypothetical protein
MHRCEVKRISACRRESSSLEAEPLRFAKQTAGAVHLQVRLAFGICRKIAGWRSVPPARISPQNSNTTWCPRCVPGSSSASSINVKSLNTKAMQALQQSSPVRKGSARPNHSVNLRANGIARCPAAAHSAALHSASSGHRAMPLAPGYLER